MAFEPFRRADAGSPSFESPMNTVLFKKITFLAVMMAEYRIFGINIAFSLQRITKRREKGNGPANALPGVSPARCRSTIPKACGVFHEP